MFETKKAGNKTSSGKNGLDIWTYASPKVVQDQVSGGVKILCYLCLKTQFNDMKIIDLKSEANIKIWVTSMSESVLW